MMKIKVNLYQIGFHWEDSDLGLTNAHIGVIQSPDGWVDEMENTHLDSEVFFYFDTDKEVLALKEGDVISDGAVIDWIDYTPLYREETIKICEGV
jgi:hypothetical protein